MTSMFQSLKQAAKSPGRLSRETSAATLPTGLATAGYQVGSSCTRTRAGEGPIQRTYLSWEPPHHHHHKNPSYHQLCLLQFILSQLCKQPESRRQRIPQLSLAWPKFHCVVVVLHTDAQTEVTTLMSFFSYR